MDLAADRDENAQESYTSLNGMMPDFQQVLEALQLDDDLIFSQPTITEVADYSDTPVEIGVIETLAPADLSSSGSGRGQLLSGEQDLLLEDPISYLEAAIEADRPKNQGVNAELQAVMDAVAADVAFPNASVFLPPSETLARNSGSVMGAEVTVSPEFFADVAAYQVTAGRGNGNEVPTDTNCSSPDIILQGPGSSGDTSPGHQRPFIHKSSSSLSPGTQLANEAGRNSEAVRHLSANSCPSGPSCSSSAGIDDIRHELPVGSSARQNARTLRQQAFALLQPVCSVLLQHKQDPKQLTQVLAGLEVLVNEIDPRGLSECLDYLLFPLLLALDCIPSYQQGGGSDGIPAMQSEQAAEAALSCVRSALQRCGGCHKGDQLLSLLQRLSSVLMLPSCSSEEVRLQALLCVSAALGTGTPAAASCAINTLGDEASAPLVGHLASLLLKCAEEEAEAGHRGSKAVRAAALAALKQLITAVRNADALAFFVPGIVTGLGKSLAAAGAVGVTSGAVSSSASAVEALCALGAILVITLGNDSSQPWCQAIDPPHASNSLTNKAGKADDDAWRTAAAAYIHHPIGPSHGLDASTALEQLRQLSIQGSMNIEASASASSSNPKSEQMRPLPHVHQASLQLPGCRPVVSSSPSSASATSREGMEGAPEAQFRVERTWGWVNATAGRVHEVLKAVLPPLCAAPQPAVRHKLAEVCSQLLSGCSQALPPASHQLLSEILFALAKDDWPDVSEVAQHCLQLRVVPERAASQQGQQRDDAAHAQRRPPAMLPCSLLEASLLRLLEELPGALRSGDGQGILHAKKLATCIEVCPPDWFCTTVLGHPSNLSALFSALVQSVEFKQEDAALLARAPPEAGTLYQAGKLLPGSTAPAAMVAGPAALHGKQNAASSDGDGGICEAEPALVSACALEGAALLPRMPHGLRLLHSSKAYQAVAAVCRAAATKAAAAGPHHGSQGSLESAVALRRLLDHGLAELQQACERARAHGDGEGCGSMASSQEGGPAAAGSWGGGDAWVLEQPWQLHAAAVVAVMSEMVLGASPAGGRSGAGCSPGSRADVMQEGVSNPPHRQRHQQEFCCQQELQSLVSAVIEALVEGSLWGLPTWQEPAGPMNAELAQQQQLTARQLGVNVLAVRVAVEAVGCCARALGPAFARPGRMLRAVLLPVLERLGDPAPLVASAAGATVGSICLHCGYGTLNRLVAENADYVVDGVCAQLRQLDRHPGAPRLLAVLMQKAGVAPELLPLLAEPARSAVQGVSILSRRRHPSHVLPFLAALAEIMYGARACAELALEETLGLVAEVQGRLEELRQQAQQAARQQQEEGGVEVDPGNKDEKGSRGSGSVEVREYFLRRQRLKAAGVVEEEGGGFEAMQVHLIPEQQAAMMLRTRRVHAAATLAHAAVDCCGPMALSTSLQVAVQAQQVCTAGLRCLRATTLVLELEEFEVQPMVEKQAEVAPPDPLTPKLLPSVHLLWTPLLAALKDWRASLVECTLGTLCELGTVAGSFLCRRFAEDCWPALQKLLREGPPGRRVVAPGQDELTSPASIQRVRCAVLSCIRHMAGDAGGGRSVAGSSGGGAEVVGAQAGSMLQVVGHWMGDRHTAVVREQATQAFMALARLDSDAAWTLLTAALARHPTAATLQPRCPYPGILPPASALCPTTLEQAGMVPAGLPECGAAKLAAMLAQVEKFAVAWHQKEGSTGI